MSLYKLPVKNFTPQRTSSVLGVCIHIAEGGFWRVYNTFNNPNELQSSHYFIRTNGDVYQFVNDSDIAWAQGRKVNPTAKLVLERPDTNPNEYLLSIEHEDSGNGDVTKAQYQSSAELVRDLAAKYNFPIDYDHIIKHNEIRQNKSCPRDISVDEIILNASVLKPGLTEPQKLSILNLIFAFTFDYLLTERIKKILGMMK